MRVDCRFPSGRIITFENVKDNYALPISSTLEISEIDCNLLYIDGKVSTYLSSPFDYHGETKLIECGNEKCRIIALIDDSPDNIKTEYQKFANDFRKCHGDQCVSDEDLLIGFNESQNGLQLNLCTFGRQIQNIENDLRLDEVVKHVRFLPNIFHRPRIHLKSVNEVKPVDAITRIGHESIKHLASHSEHWEAIRANGLMPARLLAKTLEDEYCIYENIMAKTLVDRLWKLALNERDNLKAISMQLPSDESMMTVGVEQSQYFKAREILLKGYSDDAAGIQIMGSLIEGQLSKVNLIISRLAECKDTRLYREVKRNKSIVGPIKSTNIFMMNNNYRHVYLLWTSLSSKEETKQSIKLPEITDEYYLYCSCLLIFALKYFNFKSVGVNSGVSEKSIFGEYSFKEWNLSINSIEIPEIMARGINVSISQNMNRKIGYQQLYVPTKEDLIDFDFLSVSGVDLILKRKPTNDELESFLKLIKKKVSGDRETDRKFQEFKKKISDTANSMKENTHKILLIPLPFKFADSSAYIQKCIDGLDQQLSKFITQNKVDAYYYLSPYRPNDYSEKENYSQLSNILDYGYANMHRTHAKKEVVKGFLPIAISDINSYRRLTKILLIQMIAVDLGQNTCPICGEGLTLRENSHYCQTCGLQIFATICTKCNEEFKFTKYILPKVNTEKGDTINMKMLLKECKEGFKNITDVNVESQNPLCPFCGNSQ